jgi:malonate-semialdehyde dehydrogenase (acetylating)/methylmalonate-semialdehyde dehydrogenase
MGMDGIRFFTQVKSVTSTWFNEEEMKREKIDTWDGMLGR